MEPATPYDLTNERAVLGACILDRDAITAVRDILSVEDFYLEKHGVIYAALLDLVDRRVPPDLATVAGALRDAGRIDVAGGIAYLGELCQETPTAVHVEHYARRVVQTAAQRRIIQLGAEIQLRAHQGGDVGALFDELQVMVETTKAASTPRANWSEAVVPARMLYRYKFDPTPFIVDQVLPEGTMLITGKPKTRKSWLALNFAWAVASGGKALGHYQALQGDALYIDLEMGQKRLHKRLHVVSPDLDPPRGFQFATRWPKVGEGFETWLRDYLKSHPFTRLVVVDTLVGVRASRKRYEDPYEADKAFTQALTDLCHQFRIAMLLIHHSRKADGSDVTDDASGSTGLTGGVDNFGALRLSRTEKGAGQLVLVGRDIEIDGDLGLKWDSRLAQWNVAPEGATVMLTPERRDVLGLLADRPGLKPKEIALILKRDEPGTRRLLGNMLRDNLITSAQGGYWYLVDERPDEGDEGE
jgi:hypothetical protein